MNPEIFPVIVLSVLIVLTFLLFIFIFKRQKPKPFKEGDRVQICSLQNSKIGIYTYIGVQGGVREIIPGYFGKLPGYKIGLLPEIFHPNDLEFALKRKGGPKYV